jgi:hypothetical protein
MAAKYNHVSPHIWTPAFRELRNSDPDAFELYLYLLTCRHRSSEGLFIAPLGYISIDLGMALADVKAAMATLEERAYVQYDYDFEVVLDRHALDYYEPSGKQATGALNKIESLPKTVLKAELLKVACINASNFYELIVEKFPTLFHLKGFDGRSMADASWNGDLSIPTSKSKSREPSLEEEQEQRTEDENSTELSSTGGDEEWRVLA